MHKKIVKLFFIVLFSGIASPNFAAVSTSTQKPHKIVTHKKVTRTVHRTKKKPTPIRIPQRRSGVNDVAIQPVNKPTLSLNKTSTGSHTYFPGVSTAQNLEKRLVNFVHKTVDSLRYSSYKLGGSKFDTRKGIYVLDCSSYVDNVLRTIYPRAYSNLVNATGVDNPTTHQYYEFFQDLSENSNRYWNRVDDVDSLRPGDILVFRLMNRHRMQTSGHVMIVMNQPIREGNAYLVRVADSTPYRHSNDTRQLHETGIGIGTMLLKIDPRTKQPMGYAWGVNSGWEKNVHIAMARPFDMAVS